MNWYDVAAAFIGSVIIFNLIGTAAWLIAAPFMK